MLCSTTHLKTQFCSFVTFVNFGFYLFHVFVESNAEARDTRDTNKLPGILKTGGEKTTAALSAIGEPHTNAFALHRDGRYIFKTLIWFSNKNSLGTRVVVHKWRVKVRRYDYHDTAVRKTVIFEQYCPVCAYEGDNIIIIVVIVIIETFYLCSRVYAPADPANRKLVAGRCTPAPEWDLSAQQSPAGSPHDMQIIILRRCVNGPADTTTTSRRKMPTRRDHSLWNTTACRIRQFFRKPTTKICTGFNQKSLNHNIFRF